MKNNLTAVEQQYREYVCSSDFKPDPDFIADLEAKLQNQPPQKRGFFFWWTLSTASTISMLLYGMLFLVPSTFSDIPFVLKTKGFELEKNTSQSSQKVAPFSQRGIADTTIQDSAKQVLELEAALSDQLIELHRDTLRNSFVQPFKVFGILISSKLLAPSFQKQQPKVKSGNGRQHYANRRFDFQIYGGLNFTRSYLYSDYNLVSTFDLALAASERTLQTKNFGMAVNTYCGRFQWGMGLFLTHLGEQANFSYLEEKLVETGGFNQYDTLYVAKTFTGKNEYRFIQVPLSLGYQIQTPHFVLIPKYSLAVGIRQGEQIGYYPNRNGIGLSNFFVPNVNIQHSVQAEFRTNTQKYFLTVSPYLNFNSIKTPPQVLSYRKYINYGVNVGLGFSW